MQIWPRTTSRNAGAAMLTLLSGATMMLAGYVGQTQCWRTAAFITLPGGALIATALWLAFGDRALPWRTETGGSHAAVTGLVLFSGALMIFAGFAGAAWGPFWAMLVASGGGLVIAAAFWLEK